MKSILLILLALILPGIASYIVVQRVFFPPLAYVIDGPTAGETFADAPSALMPAEGLGMRDGALADPSSPMGNPAGRPSGNNGNRPVSNTGNRPTGNNANRPAGSTPNAGTGAGRTGYPEQRGSFALMRLFTSIGRLEQDGTATLSAAQAKSILALMNPLRKQASLTSTQATTVNNKLKALLTKAQLAEIEQLSPVMGNGGGPRNGGNPGATNTPPRDGGNRPAPPAGMEDINPFNANSDNPMAQRMAERMNEVFSLLEKKAGQ